MDVGQLELRAHRQLLDQELEVVVARQADHRARRVRSHHAQRGGDRPAQRAGLAAVDPLARAVDLEELRARDLAQADGGHVHRVAAEGLVHLLVHTLRLHRDLLEVRLAVHQPLAFGAAGGAGLLQQHLAHAAVAAHRAPRARRAGVSTR